jgi:Protein of unknown function (DUF4245)
VTEPSTGLSTGAAAAAEGGPAGRAESGASGGRTRPDGAESRGVEAPGTVTQAAGPRPAEAAASGTVPGAPGSGAEERTAEAGVSGSPADAGQPPTATETVPAQAGVETAEEAESGGVSGGPAGDGRSAGSPEGEGQAAEAVGAGPVRVLPAAEPRKRKAQKTIRDMVLSLAAIGMVVAFVYLFIPHSGDDPVKTVPYRSALESARRAAPFPVLAPEGLSKEWRATSVEYTGDDPEARGAVWHLGFIDPRNQYAAVEQTNGPAQPFIEDKSLNARRHGTMQVAGQVWDRYVGGRYDALVLEGKHVTTVVTGTAPPSQLARLAAALKG